VWTDTQTDADERYTQVCHIPCSGLSLFFPFYFYFYLVCWVFISV